MTTTNLNQEVEELEAQYQQVLSLRLLMEAALLKYQQAIHGIQIASEFEIEECEQQFEQSLERYKNQLHEIEISDLVQHIKTLD